MKSGKRVNIKNIIFDFFTKVKTVCLKLTDGLRECYSTIRHISRIQGYLFWIICLYVVGVISVGIYVGFNGTDTFIHNTPDKMNEMMAQDSILCIAGPPAPGTKEAEQLLQTYTELQLKKEEANSSTINNDNSVTVVEESEIPSTMPEDKKKVYLTFDDGPSTNTSIILDVLAQNDVKATFFTVAKFGSGNEGLYNRIVNEGHTLAMHSYSHRYKEIYSSVDAFINDIDNIKNYLYTITGQTPIYYRFPGGSSVIKGSDMCVDAISYLNNQGIRYFDWNVLNGDAENSQVTLTENVLIDNIINGVKEKNTSVVLMHDADDKTATANSLPELIRQLKELDVELLPINEDTPLIQQVVSSDILNQIPAE